MKLRPLMESPFRKYAVFSGRAGRAEFWLFILTFVVITQLAWLLGFGVMKLAGFDRNHDDTAAHYMTGPSENGGAKQNSAASTQPDNALPEDGDTRIEPDRKEFLSGISDKYHAGRYHADGHDDDSMRFMVHRHGRDGYHLHGIIRDNHGFDYDGGDPDDHGRYTYRGDPQDGYHQNGYHKDGYHRKRHLYAKFHNSRAERGGNILWMISVVALLLPLLAVGTRRLHDSNHSGWWQLMALIPIAGWLVLLIFFLLPGGEDENRFGPSP